MPCFDPTGPIHNDLNSLKVQLMTRMLCDLTRRLEYTGQLNREEMTWLQWHKKEDEKAAKEFKRSGTRQRVVTFEEMLEKQKEYDSYFTSPDRPATR